MENIGEKNYFRNNENYIRIKLNSEMGCQVS